MWGTGWEKPALGPQQLPHLSSLQFLHDCNWLSGGRKGPSGYSVGTDCSWGNFPVEAQQITTIQSGTKVINKPSRRIPSCYPMLLCIICLDFLNFGYFLYQPLLLSLKCQSYLPLSKQTTHAYFLSKLLQGGIRAPQALWSCLFLILCFPFLKEKGLAVKPSRTLLVTKPLHVPHLLFAEKGFSPRSPLSSKEQTRTDTSQGREGIQK